MTEDYMKNWPPRRRDKLIGPIPYGYETKEGDPLSLVPVPELIALLEQALDAIDNGVSLREAARWLKERSGKGLSQTGISKIWRRLRDSEDNPRTKRLKALAEASKPKTRKERKVKTLNQKMGNEKRKITHAQRRLQEMAERVPDVVDKEEIKTYVELVDVPVELEEEEVIFKPHKGPQTEFLASSEQEVLYGGAAGGEPVSGFLPPPFLATGQNKLRELLECPKRENQQPSLIRGRFRDYPRVGVRLRPEARSPLL